MAPILAAEIGITPQLIDDSRLLDLRSALASIEDRVELGKSYKSSDEVEVPLDIDHLLSLIEPWQSWTFEEQVSRAPYSLNTDKREIQRVSFLLRVSCRLTCKNGFDL